MKKLHFEDFLVGAVAIFGPRRITREEIIAFAKEFDPQPFHLDDEAARNTMLGGLCASGWHTCGIMMRIIADGYIVNSSSMGAPGIDELRWKKPVRPGDDLRVRRTILDKRVSISRPEMGLIRVRFEVLNQADECVLLAHATNLFALRDPARQAVAEAGS